MKSIYKNELVRRLESLIHERGTGKAEFWDWELLIWYDGQRLSKGIWRDIRQVLIEISEDEDFTYCVFHNAHGHYTLMHPDHVKSFAKMTDEVAE